MKIAVEGCAHGELDKVYETIGHLEERNKIKVDLLIICGDFQSVRNRSDLTCMAVPPKYRKMNTFYKYYSGEIIAPVLTIFIGGNHEASNYLSELPYGGWVCPNIYYMGYANVINVGNLRIGGLSGIYKGHDYLKGHFECPPYDESTKRSAYHIRNIDVFRLKQISEPIDIFISHDWPRGIYHHGNKEELLRRKGFFKEEIEKNTLGSRPAEELLHKLKPKYWFAAHLHCKFAAIVNHNNGDNDKPLITRFLALDKCLPHRNFLQILEIGNELKGPVEIKYDSEWLSILHLTNHLLSTQNITSYMPGPGCLERWDFKVNEIEKKEIEKLFNFELTVPNNFTVTAPIHNPFIHKVDPIQVYVNPQTFDLCQKLQLTDPVTAIVSGKSASGTNISKFINSSEMNVTMMSEPSINPDEITLDSGSDVEASNKQSSANSSDGEEIINTSKLTVSNEAALANTSTIEDFGSFFIDKVGFFERSPSDSSPLTALQQRRRLHLQYCSTPQNVCDSEERMEFPQLKRDHDKSMETSPVLETPVSSCMKKFKRRNQEIYNAECSDE